jgi:hypothetical protein
VITHNDPYAYTVTYTDAKIPEPGPMSAGDVSAAMTLASAFQTIRSRKAHALLDVGFETDSMALLMRKRTHMPIPVFKNVVNKQGFNALILVDRSQSMGGWIPYGSGKKKTYSWNELSPLAQAYRGSRILTRALRGADGVSLDSWGWTSTKSGTVDILKYPKNVEIARDDNPGFLGSTPLHAAIRVGREHIKDKKGVRKIYVLTDGEPSFDTETGPVGNLERYVDEEIQKCLEERVSVTAIVIDNGTWEPYIDHMFARIDWVKVNAQDLATQMVSLIGSDILSSR